MRRVTMRQVLRSYGGRTLSGLVRGLGALGQTSAILTPAQIRWYAQGAGFTGADLDTAVAIAMAESGGNAHIYNAEPGARGGTPTGKGSYGLWQIYLRDHPEFEGQDLYDPQTNAGAAYSVFSRAGGFTPWATYNSGRYQAFLRTSSPAPVITIDPATGAPVQDSGSAASAQAAGVSAGNALLLAGSAIAAYLAAELFFD